MKIVITDGATLNPGDLDWSAIAAFGEIEYYDHTPPELVLQRCRGAAVILTNKTIVSKETISACDSLRLIAVTATGYNNIDIASATEAGVIVCNVPEYGTFSVAQHCFALILELVNHTGENIASTKRDEWAKSGTWCYTKQPITELKDKTLGIIGYGRIGKQVARIAEAFGMLIIFQNRSPVTGSTGRQVSIDEIFTGSDIVSLHCPLTAENKEMVNAHYLRKMKKSAMLVNTSRGQLIRETDLLEALNEGWIAGAALDVLSTEPPATGHPLVHHPRCLVTPHNAWLSVEARQRMMAVTVDNLRRFIEGAPQNVVNK